MNSKIKIIAFVATFVLAFSSWTEYQSVSASQDLNEIVVSTITSKPAKKSVVVSLATPRDTFQSYLNALANNDEVALYQTYSPRMLDLYQHIVSSEDDFKLKKGVTLGDRNREILEREGQAYELPEITLEKIEGSGAYLSYKNGYGGKFSMTFVKEAGNWKISTFSEYKKTEQTLFQK